MSERASGLDERLEQQRLLADTAAAFAQRELAPGRLRVSADTQLPFDRQRWQKMAELGLTGLLLPETHGGFGLQVGDFLPVLEELGRPLLREPLVASAVLAGLAIARGDNDTLKTRLLPKIGSGELVPALAWQETQAALEGQTLATTVRIDGDMAVLDGRKSFVLPGAAFEGLIVSAKSEAGSALYWIEAGSDGVAVSTSPLADGSVSATIEFHNARVSAGNRLGGEEALDYALGAATLCASAELLGLVRGAIAMTLEYLRTRKQFGRAIGAFQALQHRAADLFVQQELCAAALKQAAADFESAADAGSRAAAASRAKARCSSAALLVAKEAVQMHGGIGFTDEHDIGLYLKRALVLSAWLGNAAEHRRRFARLTFDMAA